MRTHALVLTAVLVLAGATCGKVTVATDDAATDHAPQDHAGGQGGSGGGGTGGGGVGGGGVGGGTGGARDAGTQCTVNNDCVLYGPGVGGCCGDCLPKTAPQPGTVQCLIPCSTPLNSCTCNNGTCVGAAN